MSDDGAVGWILAIDFGTTNTTAAMAAPDGSGPAVLEIENSKYLPSVVYRDEAGQLVTGRSAVRQAVAFPERAERIPKRALVAGDQVLLGGQPVAVTDLVAAVLSRVYGEAVRFHGGQPPARTVLTCPARWGSAQRERLLAAAGAAGISDPELVPEPVAAAWWHARPSAGRVVAVFDFGGGTLDTAVLRATAAGYEIAGPPGGDANLGGEDFDELLLAKVADLARERDAQLWADEFGGEGPRVRRDQALLRADVTTAKESLSDHLTTDLAVVGYQDAFRLTRAEFDDLISSDVTRAAAELRQTITAAGLEPAQVDAIYLTGGSSRIPAISARIAEAMGRLPEMRDDPKAVVALGALTASTAPAPAPAPAVAPGAEEPTAAFDPAAAFAATAPAGVGGAPRPATPPRRRMSPLPLLAGLGAVVVAAGVAAGVLASHHSPSPNVNNNTTPVTHHNTHPDTHPVTSPSTTPPTPSPTPTTPSPTPPAPTPNQQQTLLAVVPSGVASYCQSAQPSQAIQGWTAGLVCADSQVGYNLTYTLFDNQDDLENYYDQTFLSGIGISEDSGSCSNFETWDAPCETGYTNSTYQISGRVVEFDPNGLFEIGATDDAQLILVTIMGVDSGSLLGYWDQPPNWVDSAT